MPSSLCNVIFWLVPGSARPRKIYEYEGSLVEGSGILYSAERLLVMSQVCGEACNE
jgi:hypothetical protein